MQLFTYLSTVELHGIFSEKFGGAQSGYFRNFGRFYGFFIAISEIIGGARAPPAPPVTTPLNSTTRRRSGDGTNGFRIL